MPTAAATGRWTMDLAQRAADWLRPGVTARSLYQVLGLPSDVDEAQIKAAYRELARRYHPDVNAGDAASARCLAEINHAYEILGDQRSRAAYDLALAGQRMQMRRHYALLAVCTGATFAITLAAVSLLVRWQLGAAQPEPPLSIVAGEPGGKTALPVTVHVAGSDGDGSLVQKPADEPGWTTFSDPHFAFTLSYPAAIFSFDPEQSDANMHTFVSRDRRAIFRIVASENTAGVTLARFRSTLIRKRYAGASFEQTPQRRNWFALAGTLGDEAFLERVTFSCDGKALHGWQIRYPLSQRATYDELAKQMLRNQPAACVETRRKRSR